MVIPGELSFFQSLQWMDIGYSIFRYHHWSLWYKEAKRATACFKQSHVCSSSYFGIMSELSVNDLPFVCPNPPPPLPLFLFFYCNANFNNIYSPMCASLNGYCSWNYHLCNVFIMSEFLPTPQNRQTKKFS